MPKKDPYHHRERQKYDEPIPSREYIIQTIERFQKPVRFNRLTKELWVDKPSQRTAVRRRLDAMVRSGQILENREGQYLAVEQLPLIKGVVHCKKDGRGWINTEDPQAPIIHVSPFEMRSLIFGDHVLVRLTNQSNEVPQGVIVDVIKRGSTHVVGLYREDQGHAIVQPLDSRMNHTVLCVPGSLSPSNGQFVQSKIIQYPTRKEPMLVRVTELMGDFDQAFIEQDLVMAQHGLRSKWEPSVLEELKQLPDRVNEEDLKDRDDWRNHLFVTIDGDDARDYDDAVCIEPEGNGWRIRVAIADVAHYVQQGSCLDQEAYLRATSVYFPGRMIPMLPEALSCHLCSLREESDRLAMGLSMHLDRDGTVKKMTVHEVVIRVHRRLTYQKVNQMWHGSKPTPVWWVESLTLWKDCLSVFLKLRKKRGTLDFDFPELKPKMGSSGKIEGFSHGHLRGPAERLIEEVMVLSNAQVAMFLDRNKRQALFRVHEEPKEEKRNELRKVLKPFKIPLPGNRSHDYAKVIQQIKAKEIPDVYQMMVLRCMNQAKYVAENEGHFGLALEHYLHFTSPIRRYPDLIVHRALKSYLHQQPQCTEGLDALAIHCSAQERVAEMASRDVLNWLKCQFLSHQVGTVFSAKITSVVSFGLFVALDETGIEGLVHISRLTNDFYQFDSEKMCLVGKDRGLSFHLGDSITVRLIDVNVLEQFIDFSIVD